MMVHWAPTEGPLLSTDAVDVQALRQKGLQQLPQLQTSRMPVVVSSKAVLDTPEKCVRRLGVHSLRSGHRTRFVGKRRSNAVNVESVLQHRMNCEPFTMAMQTHFGENQRSMDTLPSWTRIDSAEKGVVRSQSEKYVLSGPSAISGMNRTSMVSRLSGAATGSRTSTVGNLSGAATGSRTSMVGNHSGAATGSRTSVAGNLSGAAAMSRTSVAGHLSGAAAMSRTSVAGHLSGAGNRTSVAGRLSGATVGTWSPMVSNAAPGAATGTSKEGAMPATEQKRGSSQTVQYIQFDKICRTFDSTGAEVVSQSEPKKYGRGEGPDFETTLQSLRSSDTRSKAQEWFIEQLEMLQEQGIPQGVEALRVVLKNKCGSLPHAFAKLDYNGNGELSMLEFAGGLAGLFPPLPHGRNSIILLSGMSEQQLFRVLDADRQGTIGLNELAGEGAVAIRQERRKSALKKIDFGLARPSVLEKPSWSLPPKRECDNPNTLRRRVKDGVASPRLDSTSPMAEHGRSSMLTTGGKMRAALAFLSPQHSVDDVVGTSLSPKGSPHRGGGRLTAPSEDVFVLVAKWTTLLARQKCKKDSSPLHSPTSKTAEEDWDSQSEDEISSAVDYAEQMLHKVFDGVCGGYKKRNEYLMTRPRFFEFFSDMSADLSDNKLHSLYDSQLELQRDLTMATYGFAITEGLNYDSFRVSLHRAVVQMKLNLHHVIGDLVSEYESFATAQVGSWKRQRSMEKSKARR